MTYSEEMRAEMKGTRRKLFRMSVYDEKRLALSLYDLNAGDFNYTLDLIRGFPQRRYSRDHESWLVNMTEANFEYLAANFSSEEYDMDEEATLVHQYHVLSRESLDRREARRWEYVFDDKVPTIDGFTPPRESYGHQTVGLDSMHGAEYFALLMETGTGKTKTTVDEIYWSALEREEAGKGALRVIIVCPKSLRGTWLNEFEKWLPDDYCYWAKKLRGGIGGLRDLVEGVKADVPLKGWIVSYDSVKNHLPHFEKMKFHIAVLDESTHIKSPGAKRTKACMELAEVCDRRFILTGTPVANNVMDLYSQFQFLRDGILGYDSYYAFKHRYAIINKRAGYESMDGFQNLDELKGRMAKCSFVVRKKDCLDLPEQTWQTRTLELSPKQSELYADMLRTFIASLDDAFAAEGTARAQIILTQYLRLSQICSGFLKTEAGGEVRINGADGKVDALDQILREIDPNSKVVIWARFQNDIKTITKLLRKRKISYGTITGSDSETQRQWAVDSFSDDDGIRVIVGEPGTGGMGLTLTGSENKPCATMIFFNNDWSLLKRQQAEDRIYRIGTKVPVTYYDLVFESTIEEVIADRLSSKKEVADYMKDYGSIRELLTDSLRAIEGREGADDAA